MEKELDSYIIPYKEESKNLIFTAAKNLDNSLIGWDLAFTNDGPMLIEGNSNPEMNYLQYSMGGFENDQDLYSFMKRKINEKGINNW